MKRDWLLSCLVNAIENDSILSAHKQEIMEETRDLIKIMLNTRTDDTLDVVYIINMRNKEKTNAEIATELGVEEKDIESAFKNLEEIVTTSMITVIIDYLDDLNYDQDDTLLFDDDLLSEETKEDLLYTRAIEYIKQYKNSYNLSKYEKRKILEQCTLF